MRTRQTPSSPSGPAQRMAVGYALLASLAIALVLALREGPPWAYPKPWLHLEPNLGLALSAGLGVALAMVLIAWTRFTVPRFGWAQRLHTELRPAAKDLTLPQILLLAGLSSLGEELLFRGLLTSIIGVALSSILFGLAHQMKGPSRWVWTAWAMIVGLGLGAIFAMTGSLVGPLLAHAIVNAVNLSYLRDFDPGTKNPTQGLA